MRQVASRGGFQQRQHGPSCGLILIVLLAGNDVNVLPGALVAVLVAKWVGQRFTPSLYHRYVAQYGNQDTCVKYSRLLFAVCTLVVQLSVQNSVTADHCLLCCLLHNVHGEHCHPMLPEPIGLSDALGVQLIATGQPVWCGFCESSGVWPAPQPPASRKHP